MINFRLKWHPQFSIHKINSAHTLFLGENEQLLIKNKEFNEINQVIDDDGMLSDYIFKDNNIAAQISRMERLDGLIAENMLTGNDAEGSPHYSTSDFTGKIVRLHRADKDILLLSSLVDKHLITHWLSNIGSFPSDTTLVVVDDYLNPILAQLNEEFLYREKKWLIMKPIGQTPMIGPLFTPKNPNFPCYYCLYTRLKQNKPVREWIRRQSASQHHTAVPVLVDNIYIQNMLERFKKHYFEQILTTQRPGAGLYAFSATAQNSEVGDFHPLVKRPQCQVCGNPNWFGEQNNKPIVLADRKRHMDADGGYRYLSRSETVDNISRLISPITGIITELTEVTDEAKDTMSIYQAAYYQNTYISQRITPDTFIQLSLGKGVSDLQAKSSALGEALERQAAQYNGEEVFIYVTVEELNGRVFRPQQLSPFSQNQYKYFAQFDEASLANPQWVAEYQDNVSIHWVRGWSLSNSEHVYFPAAYCFANTPFDDHKYSLYTHNGNAAGNTMEEAILQGTLELIERDAAAIWWYNQIPRPAISLEIIPTENRARIANTLDKDWDYWVLDISHDIGVVSCVAVGQHKDTQKFVMGFGSHLDPSIACQRALTEMHQLITIKDKVSGPFDFGAVLPYPYLYPKRNTAIKTTEDYRSISSIKIKYDILYLLEELKKSKLELCVVNYTRADICLKTIKVIVPGLCHFWPQLGNERLYDVPVRLGWLSKPVTENELNKLDLYL